VYGTLLDVSQIVKLHQNRVNACEGNVRKGSRIPSSRLSTSIAPLRVTIVHTPGTLLTKVRDTISDHDALQIDGLLLGSNECLVSVNDCRSE
jgi:hypothetical protein